MSKILIVEDNQVILQLYKDLLSTSGHSVDTADEGDIALKKMEKGGYDLVLLDNYLPKRNGIDILKFLKEMPPLKTNKKVILTTNAEDDHDIREAISLCSGYLIKSQLTPDVFLTKIETFLK
jgi:CheY-like chemotaxis protein